MMRQFPADLMRMWPISTRVNKPENDDPSILKPIELATDAALTRATAVKPSLLLASTLPGFLRGSFARCNGLLNGEFFELRPSFQFLPQPT
jgi:hypothetical protein